MPGKEKVITQISDFFNLYTLIFGAIMVVLGVQLIILALALGPIETVCFSIPLLLFGGLLVYIMLQDKVYHRVFYRPAYYPYYSLPGYTQPAYSPPPPPPPPPDYQGEPPPPSDSDIPYARPASPQNALRVRPPVYYPPYYGGYGHGYGSPYFGIPYITYVQYFRETLSIPQIRSLLIIFLVSIIGGSVVLLVGGPYIFLFPIFFIIAFTFPSFIWISYVYHKDVLEPESKHGIFLVLSWGMFSTLFAIFPNTLSAYYFELLYSSGIALIITAVVVAPFNEEFFKPLGLRRVRGEMNSELDGLIYGVTCGMGFAIIENFSYELGFLFSGESPAVIWTFGSFIRGIGSTIIHAAGAGLIGFTYARLRILKMKQRNGLIPPGESIYDLSLPAAYLIAVGLHALWNGSASLSSIFDNVTGIILSFGGLIVAFIIAFHIIKSLANEGIRRDMERHGRRGYVNPVQGR